LDGVRVQGALAPGLFFSRGRPGGSISEPIAAAWNAQISEAESALLEELG